MISFIRSFWVQIWVLCHPGTIRFVFPGDYGHVLTFFAGFDLLQDFGSQGFGCHFLHGFSFLRIQLLGFLDLESSFYLKCQFYRVCTFFLNSVRDGWV